MIIFQSQFLMVLWKDLIEYILHRRQSDYDTDSDESDGEDEEIIDNENLKQTIDNTLKQQIDDISHKKSISNNLKQLLISNLLKQSEINKFLKDSTIKNKESMINNILNKKTTNNDETINNNEKIINNKNTYVEIRICIRSKKAVMNPKSNDNKSFQYSITLYWCHKEIGNGFNRITKIEPYTINFNWNNINFPPIKQDYENFEINNENHSLNIYEINNEKISQLYKSNYDREKKHYYY